MDDFELTPPNAADAEERPSPLGSPRLDQADIDRLQRIGNRRAKGRSAKVPARLVRTAAFAPKSRGLITDSKFERVYVVPGHSFVRVSGRELGSPHRDAIYAVFRLPHQETVIEEAGAMFGFKRLFLVRTTWRKLLQAMNKTEHANNVVLLHYTFEDIKKVVVNVYEGDHQLLLEDYRAGRLKNVGRGRMGNMLEDIEWTGFKLDDEVRISYGDWTAMMIHKAKLVSLNADVHFRLQSEFAKCFWPYIESMTLHSWVDEKMLGHLVGRDVFGSETAEMRRQFRFYCRKAFKDMVRSGGLKSFRVEVRGAGRQKLHRYHYERMPKIQGELPLKDEGAVPVEAQRDGEMAA